MAKLEGVKVNEMVSGEITKVTYEGEVYTLTDSEEEYGDIALVVNAWGNQEVGEYYKVIKEEHGLYHDRRNKAGMFVHIAGEVGYASAEREYVRLFRKVGATDVKALESRVAELEAEVERLKAEKEGAEATLKPGVFVKLLEGGEEFPLYGFKNGGIYEVTHVRDLPDSSHEKDGRIRIIRDTGGQGFPLPSQVEIVTERKQAGESAQAMQAPLKVGDLAKVIGGTWYGDIGEGNVVKITRDKDADGDYGITLLDDSDWDKAQASSLERLDLTEEEAQVYVNFAKIGRKPNEYRKGDIVRVTEGFDEIKKGDIGEITHADGSKFPGVTARGVEWYVGVELITPVEQRFDKQGESQCA